MRHRATCGFHDQDELESRSRDILPCSKSAISLSLSMEFLYTVLTVIMSASQFCITCTATVAKPIDVGRVTPEMTPPTALRSYTSPHSFAPRGLHLINYQLLSSLKYSERQGTWQKLHPIEYSASRSGWCKSSCRWTCRPYSSQREYATSGTT